MHAEHHATDLGVHVGSGVERHLRHSEPAAIPGGYQRRPKHTNLVDPVNVGPAVTQDTDDDFLRFPSRSSTPNPRVSPSRLRVSANLDQGPAAQLNARLYRGAFGLLINPYSCAVLVFGHNRKFQWL